MKIYLEQVSRTNEFVAGLRKKFSLVKDKGITEELIAQLDADNKLLEGYNEEIEKLKAITKEKSREAARKLLEAKMRVKATKKIVKQNFEKDNWIDFGIKDKR